MAWKAASDRRRRRGPLVLLLAALLALSVAVAGCGGGDDAAAAGDVAGYVPAGAPFYLEVTTDLDGAQWEQLRDLAETFPSFPDLQARIERALRSEDVRFEEEIRPLLGERAAVAALEVPDVAGLGSLTAPSGDEAARAADEAGFVGVVGLADDAEDGMRELLRREGGTPVGEHEGVEILADRDRETFAAVTDGVAVFSDAQQSVVAALEAGRGGREASLAGDARFEDTLSALPEDVFAKAWVDLGRVVSSGLEATPQAAQLGDLGQLRDAALGASVLAEPEGLRVQGVVTGVPDLTGDAGFTPALTANVPADAVAYLGFSNVSGTIQRLVEQLQGSAGDDVRQQVEGAAAFLPALLGVSLDDLRALGSGEHAIVVSDVAERGVGAALALQVEDGARAETTLERLRAQLPQLLDGDDPAGAPRWRPVPLAGGVSGWQLPVTDGISAVYGVDGQLAILGTTPQAVRAVQRPAEPLADQEAFQEAIRGMPERVTSLMWLNLDEAVTAGERLGAFEEAPPELLPNLRNLRDAVGWTTGGERPEFELFLRVDR